MMVVVVVCLSERDVVVIVFVFVFAKCPVSEPASRVSACVCRANLANEGKRKKKKGWFDDQ